MPTNIVIASTAIVTSVCAAFFASGGRNAGTPFDTASTPVIAVQPFENAVSSRNSAERAAADRQRVRRLSIGTHRPRDEAPGADARSARRIMTMKK